MFEKIEFQGKLWRVIAKVEGHRIADPNSLKQSYMCDMVIRSNQNIFYMLEQIIDAEYEEL